MLSQLKAQAAARLRDLAQRGSDLVEAKLKLLEAKGRLALSALQRTGISFGVYALAGIIALVGFFTAVAAGCVALVPIVGVPIALAITGGGLIVLALIAVLIGKAVVKAAERKARREYETAELAAAVKTSEAIHPTGPRVGPDHLLPPGTAAAPTNCAPEPAPAHVKSDSTLVALSAAAFAVSALVGPRKTAKLIKRSASAAAKTAAAVRLARKTIGTNGALSGRASILH